MTLSKTDERIFAVFERKIFDPSLAISAIAHSREGELTMNFIGYSENQIFWDTIKFNVWNGSDMFWEWGVTEKWKEYFWLSQ